MAVLAVWQCDRDGSMFQDKKAAEEYDRMLELAENISALVEHVVPDLQQDKTEAIGLFLAKHRELLAKACKGKPELLNDALQEGVVDATGEAEKVTPIKAKA